MAVVIITTQYGLADISFKWDPDVIAIVKQIPSRVWDAQGKYWTITTNHVPTLANWLVQKGHTVSVNGIAWADMTPRKKGEINPFKDLMTALPEKYRAGTYKALVKVFHPDTGGDVELMKKLNEVKP